MKNLLFAILVLFSLGSLNAQERIVHGVVTAFDTIPLIGASVKVLSTKQLVETDSLGCFAIGCEKQDKLKITADGFYNQTVKLASNKKYVIAELKLKSGSKNREYALGYFNVKDRERVNSIANLNENELDFSRYSNLYEVIQGRFTGVRIVNGEIIVRGVNSISSSSAALIVVDGVPSGPGILSSLQPVQIKSINILKGSSTTIYGNRGANGVVVIETKKAELKK